MIRGTKAPLTEAPLFPILRRLLFATTGILFVFHFLVTAIYLTPLNPIKLKLDSLVNAWMLPLFRQNWHLFAPNPLSSNHSLIVKCRIGETTSDWLDITSGILNRYYENRLSSAKAIGGIQINTIMSFVRGGISTEEPLLASYCQNEGQESAFCSSVREQAGVELERVRRILIGTASDGCRQVMGEQVEDIFIRIAQLIYPRFSERHKPDHDGEAIAVDLGWHPAQ